MQPQDYNRRGACVCVRAWVSLLGSVGSLGTPTALGAGSHSHRLKPIMGNTLGQDRAKMAEEGGGGATEVFLGSFPAVSRGLGFLLFQSPIQVLFLPDKHLQAPVHPTCNSFLPLPGCHLKKESDGRRGGK